MLTPKKQSKVVYIIAVALCLIVMFLALEVAMVFDDIEAYEEISGERLKGGEAFRFFIERLEYRLTNNAFEWNWSRNVKLGLIWGTLICFIGVAYWQTSLKKYIFGKEYGTSEWGKHKDISDLFAVNIMKKAIKQAKRVRFPLSRWLAKRKVKKECRNNAYDVMCAELRRLDLKEQDELSNAQGHSKKETKQIRKRYATKRREIKGALKYRTSELYKEAWKPAALKSKYKQDLEGIEKRYRQRLEITNDEERNLARKTARKAYKKALKAFYKGKGKIAEINKKYENADAIFTKTERISIHNYVLNNNTLIIGGSGSGKTRSFVMPNVLQAHSSFVITDPKGEILEKSGYFLENIAGYKIRVLNLDDKTKSDGYNPFSYIHPEREGYEERVLMLIETIIVNTEGEKTGGVDPFWGMAERLFLQSIFFFTCDGFEPKDQTINTVLSLIAMLEIGEEEDNCDSGLDFFVQIFAERHGEDHIGVQQYREFRSKASGKTAKSIVISAVARLSPFRPPAIREMFSYDSMELDRLGEEKMAIFVVVPPTDNTFNFVAGMLFTQMFQELQYCATQIHKHEGQRLPVPVRFILDEYANTCKIPQFTKILAYARSFGVGIVPVLQSIDQIKALHKDEWGVIVDNCNTLLYLGSITHTETLEYVSKLLGKGTFDKRTTGKSTGRNSHGNRNYDVLGRDLMDAAEIRKLPKKDCLLIVGGRNPFYSEKYDYTSHPNYKYTSDANPSYSYEYEPQRYLETEIERIHGEYGILSEAKKKADRIIDEISVDEIKMNFDGVAIINRVSQSLESYEPISNELIVDSEDDKDLDALEILNFGKPEVKLSEIIKNVSSQIEETEQRIEENLSENRVEFSDNSKKIAETLASAQQNLSPLENSLLPDEDDEFVSDDISDELIDDDVGELGELISQLSEILEI